MSELIENRTANDLAGGTLNSCPNAGSVATCVSCLLPRINLVAKTSLVLQLVLVIFLLAVWATASVRDNEILYLGGTAKSLSQGTKGKFSLQKKDSVQFISDKNAMNIPYRSIIHLAYGEKITRRIFEAMTVSWLFIFTERHQHLISIEFVDDSGNKQVGAFEVGKDNIQSVVTILENRSGLKFEFESKRAEDDFRKGDFRSLYNH